MKRTLVCLLLLAAFSPARAVSVFKSSATFAGPNFNGSNSGLVDGAGTLARFGDPMGVATDASGNVYVADYGSNAIRKITPGGVVTTLAGGTYGFADGTGASASFRAPYGVAVDGSGNVYVADLSNCAIRKITPGGVVTTLAGDGVPGYREGTGASARFGSPSGIAVDGAGNVYVADGGNHAIRKITPGGEVTTLVGGIYPYGVAVDGSGNLYVADSAYRVIRKITPGGVVTTLAGGTPGFADGTGSSARFANPAGVAVDGSGNVYVADVSNHAIRKITPGGVVTTLAGGTPGFADGTGSSARFYSPFGVAVDGSGHVYVADSWNTLIRKITPGGVVTTPAGAAPIVGFVDATGTGARFSSPSGAALDGSGNVYVADAGNHAIRKITPGGGVTTLAGNGTSGFADGTGSSARFYDPQGVAVDGSGNVYVADVSNNAIRKITPGGVVTTLAGGTYGFADGTGASARFYSPRRVAVDASGNVYVADAGNHAIRKITPGGVVTTLAGNGTYGFADGTGASARFYFPTGVAVDSSGNVYVADGYNHAIRKITPGGVVTTLAGNGTAGFADDTGSSARFDYPAGVALDSSGHIYVADAYNYAIRKITPGGVVTTMFDAVLDGVGYYFPADLAVDGQGRVYAVDPTNHRIVKHMMVVTTVTSANDDGPGSLRSVLMNVAEAPGANTVDFDASLSGATITLASELAITDTDGVTIAAGTLGIAISGGGATRIFSVAGGASLALENLTLTAGQAGEGGAIANAGTTTLTRCTIAGNTSTGNAGAIHNTGTLIATASTFTANVAGASGGALFNLGSATLTHCTVAANSASADGGGIRNDGALTLAHAIVSGNSAGASSDLHSAAGVTLVGANIVPGFGSAADPRLGALASNGGPTQTMKLLTGSPARNAAAGSTIASDQRGAFIVGTPDLGAYESHAPIAVDDFENLPTAATITIDVLANDSSPDLLSLTITSASRPRAGRGTILGGSSIQYTPNGRYAGTDSFTYTITDANGEASVATVRIRNLYPGYTGTFQSLIATGTPSRDGLATVTIGRTGSFTLSLKTATGTFTKTGVMDRDGNATVTIPRTGLPSLTVSLALNVTNGAFGISVDDTTGAVSGSFTKKIVYSSANPSPDAGRYTMLLPAPEQLPLAEATATPVITAGKITGITLTSGGAGFTNAPKITFNRVAGTGTNAAATAIVANGVVTGFTITNMGTGYTDGTTLTIAPPEGLPRGTGYATVTVSNSGAVVVAGKLGDGTGFSAGGFMDANYTSFTYAGNEASFPLYAKAYAIPGRIYGTLHFRDVTDVSDFDGTIHWHKPAQTTAQMFQKGFTTTTTAIGSLYVAPAIGDYVLDLEATTGNAQVALSDGNLASPITKLVTITPASATATISNKVSVVTPDTDMLAVTLTASTGLFSGSFVPNPAAPTVKATFTGVLFQKQNLGAGVFSGATQTGSVSISTP